MEAYPLAIIISRGGRNAKKIDPAPIDEEAYLQDQDYVARSPESLPLEDLKEDSRLLVIGREFGTASGPIDVLALDRDGDLYIIETKLYKNPDKRLVIAQMLDYGAAIWQRYGNPDDFLAEVDRSLRTARGGGLDEQLKKLYALSDDQVAELRQALKRKILEGAMKFIVLMDRLNDRLRHLILFINQKSKFDIYAVEMTFYRHDGLEIVIPKLYGAEVRKDAEVSTPTDPVFLWDANRFLAVAKKTLAVNPAAAAALTRLLRFSQETAEEVRLVNLDFHGRGCLAHVHFEAAGKRPPYSISTSGELQINLKWLSETSTGSEFRRRLEKRLRSSGFSDLRKGRWHRGISLKCDQWCGKEELFEEAIRQACTGDV
jgi:hypothetical protein